MELSIHLTFSHSYLSLLCCCQVRQARRTFGCGGNLVAFGSTLPMDRHPPFSFLGWLGTFEVIFVPFDVVHIRTVGVGSCTLAYLRNDGARASASRANYFAAGMNGSTETSKAITQLSPKHSSLLSPWPRTRIPVQNLINSSTLPPRSETLFPGKEARPKLSTDVIVYKSYGRFFLAYLRLTTTHTGPSTLYSYIPANKQQGPASTNTTPLYSYCTTKYEGRVRVVHSRVQTTRWSSLPPPLPFYEQALWTVGLSLFMHKPGGYVHSSIIRLYSPCG